MDLNPIMIVEDDPDDQFMITQAAEHLKIARPILFFGTGDELLSHLETSAVAPFIIISDLQLPGFDGMEIKRQIDENLVLRHKGIPFILWSSTAPKHQIQAAYSLPAQGFFVKASGFDQLCKLLTTILDYWQNCVHPKDVK